MEEEIEMFVCFLDSAKTQCKSQEITILMKNLNTKVGKVRDYGIVGNFRRGSCKKLTNFIGTEP